MEKRRLERNFFNVHKLNKKSKLTPHNHYELRTTKEKCDKVFYMWKNSGLPVIPGENEK